MKRFTSARNLMNIFGINPIQAILIRHLVLGKIEIIDSEFYRNLFPNTFRWIDSCILCMVEGIPGLKSF
jgi:hypothetical protein